MASPLRFTKEIEYVVRGYHVYKDKWEPLVGETLDCEKEISNPHDLYSVAVVHRKKGVVGHLPRTISRVSSSFIDKGSVIQVCITAKRQHSELPQGGLDLPCKISFSGPQNIVKKCIKVIRRAINDSEH